MLRKGSLVLGSAVLTVIFAGCATSSPSSHPNTGPAAVVLALPTVIVRGGACRGVGLAQATLRGDPSDTRVAWITTPSGRVDVVFPFGFVARFNPRLEVLDGRGMVVARDGDAVSGACTTGSDAGGPLLILSQ